MKAKQLIEMLLKDLDPKSEIEVELRKGSDESKDKGIVEVFDAGYHDGKFLITIMEWI